MGLLDTAGRPLTWGTEENNNAIRVVLAHGMQQFLYIYKAKRDLDNFPFQWGEEIECQLVNVAGGEVHLALDAASVLERLQQNRPDVGVWHPEYGSFMVESTPKGTYNLSRESLCSVESNIKARYAAIDAECPPNTFGLTLVTFPLMGVGAFTTVPGHAAPYSHSLFVPDSCINQSHPRFHTLTENIRLRRGRKVCIQIPLYIDRHTMARAVDQRLNIDLTPMNKDINCGVADGAKKRRTSKFGAAMTTSSASGAAAVGSGVARKKIEDERTTVGLAETGMGRAAGAAGSGNVEEERKEAQSNSSVQATSGGGDSKQTGINVQSPTTPLSNSSSSSLAAEEGRGDGSATQGLPDMVHAPDNFSSPAMLYYYAQYYTDHQRQHVKERYEACPCPVPWVSQPCIYMDCMAFGMGCDCLQVTMQFKNEHEARYAYDQLAVLCPLFLALSSATPFQKGLLCDSDVRWLTIAASVDDRKRDEYPKLLKSRYDSISVFIAPDVANLEEFNDTPIELNQECYELLRANEVDERLARHVSYLFMRDPLTIFDKMIYLDDRATTVHFENIQSTNWQSVRFKPPPPNTNIGWRVEFRVMEVQPTPFENAAFATFVALLTAAIMKYKPVFYTKLSLVDENIGRAHRINPCGELYTMRKNIFCTQYTSSEGETEQLNIDTIFNGREDGYYGLIPLVRRYLKEEALDAPQLEVYLRFLSMRASGQIPTAAQYLRRFVMQHPDYKQDSRLTMSVAHDLTVRIHSLATGAETDESYLPMHCFRTQKRGRDEVDRSSP